MGEADASRCVPVHELEKGSYISEQSDAKPPAEATLNHTPRAGGEAERKGHLNVMR